MRYNPTMIRRAMIVVFTLAAFVTGALGVTSSCSPSVWTISEEPTGATRISFRPGAMVVVIVDTSDFHPSDPGPEELWFDFSTYQGGVGAPMTVSLKRAERQVDSLHKKIKFWPGDIRTWRATLTNVASIEFPRPEVIHLTLTPAGTGGRSAVRVTGAILPLWKLFILFAIYPTIAFIRGPVRRWRRRKRGLCVNCGYDLTGNVSVVCPECGRPT